MAPASTTPIVVVMPSPQTTFVMNSNEPDALERSPEMDSRVVNLKLTEEETPERSKAHAQSAEDRPAATRTPPTSGTPERSNHATTTTTTTTTTVTMTPSYSNVTTETDPSSSSFVLPKCYIPPDDEYLPVEKFVETGVRLRHYGLADPKGCYNAIFTILKNPHQDVGMAHKFLLALRMAGHGSTLNLLTSTSSSSATTSSGGSHGTSTSSIHARLIHQMIKMNPFELPSLRQPTASGDNTTSASSFADYNVVDAQLHLILAVVSANSVYLIPALTSLWRMLISSVPSNITDVEERSNRLHASIASILRLSPRGRSELFPIMASHAPFRGRPEAELGWYYKQCLAVLRYLPSIQGQVLELIVDKCIEIDVEIKIKDGGEAVIDHNKDEDDDDAIFDLEVNTAKESTTKADVLSVDTQVDEMADKLDSLMLLVFQFIESRASNFGRDSVLALYGIFIGVFESSILITHKSKFVQFLILYLCGLDQKLTSSTLEITASTTCGTSEVVLHRDFATRLVKVLLDPYRVTGTRQSAACYLASWVSRASFVCAETACKAISALLQWAEAYMSTFDSLSLKTDDAQGQCNLHSLFYTVCQSAFYIMCFRGVEAIKYYHQARSTSVDDGIVDRDHVDIGPARWTAICNHSLQPLRFCLESVRVEFLDLVAMYKLIDDFSLQKLTQQNSQLHATNKVAENSKQNTRRKKRAETKISTPAMLEKERLVGGVGGLGQGTNPLDSFFPFDPFLLRRAHIYVEPFYKHWSDITPPIVEGESAFGADGTLMHESDDEQDDDESTSDEEQEVERSDDEEETDDACNFAVLSGSLVQPMSLASQATNSSSFQSRSPLAMKETFHRSAWADSVKRERATSIENGSW